jgi:uncharacterized protein YdeI (BOF family)
LTAPLVLGAVLSVSAWADNPDPYAKADDTWISLSGEVQSVAADQFTLDYGDGRVLVEMDDGDRDADAYKLLEGDKVTVTGRVDDDFFESTSIEAASVYVENIGTTFFASSVDEESREQVIATTLTPIVVSRLEVRGTVTRVNGDDFTLDTGTREMTVDVGGMLYDPLDDEGYQHIDVGDRVKVVGNMATELFEGRQLKADSIVEIYRDSSWGS